MAASIPHEKYSSDYYTNFSTELCNGFLVNGSLTMNMLPPLTSCYETNSPVSVASFPDQFVAPQLSEMEMGFGDFAAYDFQHRHMFEPGEACSGLVPNYSCPAYFISMPAQNWGIQGTPVTKVEETQVKVGRYTVEEKKDRILRYLKKRNRRNFNKTIKYACRKTLADKRVRVRGRFAKNNEPCEEIVMNTTPDTSYEQNNLFYEDNFQMKYEEDVWLQTAMANLMHLPYLAI